MVDSAGRSQNHVKSVEKLFTIVEQLETTNGTTITRLASELNMAKSTVYRYVRTLEDLGYVVSESNEIRLSTAFLRIGNSIRYWEDSYYLVEPAVETLADKTGERANFYIEERGSAVCIHRKLGENGVRANTRIGRSFPMHATAAGKAILSRYSRGHVDQITKRHGLTEETENTITSTDELRDELDTIRDRQLAINDGEYIDNLRGLGTPICSNESEVLGAITVSGPKHRLSVDRFEELKEKILAAKNEIELKIEYDPIG